LIHTPLQDRWDTLLDAFQASRRHDFDAAVAEGRMLERDEIFGPAARELLVGARAGRRAHLLSRAVEIMRFAVRQESLRLLADGSSARAEHFASRMAPLIDRFFEDARSETSSWRICWSDARARSSEWTAMLYQYGVVPLLEGLLLRDGTSGREADQALLSFVRSASEPTAAHAALVETLATSSAYVSDEAEGLLRGYPSRIRTAEISSFLLHLHPLLSDTNVNILRNFSMVSGFSLAGSAAGLAVSGARPWLQASAHQALAEAGLHAGVTASLLPVMREGWEPIRQGTYAGDVVHNAALSLLLGPLGSAGLPPVAHRILAISGMALFDAAVDPANRGVSPWLLLVHAGTNDAMARLGHGGVDGIEWDNRRRLRLGQRIDDEVVRLFGGDRALNAGLPLPVARPANRWQVRTPSGGELLSQVFRELENYIQEFDFENLRYLRWNGEGAREEVLIDSPSSVFVRESDRFALHLEMSESERTGFLSRFPWVATPDALRQIRFSPSEPIDFQRTSRGLEISLSAPQDVLPILRALGTTERGAIGLRIPRRFTPGDVSALLDAAASCQEPITVWEASGTAVTVSRQAEGRRLLIEGLDPQRLLELGPVSWMANSGEVDAIELRNAAGHAVAVWSREGVSFHPERIEPIRSDEPSSVVGLFQRLVAAPSTRIMIHGETNLTLRSSPAGNGVELHLRDLGEEHVLSLFNAVRALSPSWIENGSIHVRDFSDDLARHFTIRDHLSSLTAFAVLGGVRTFTVSDGRSEMVRLNRNPVGSSEPYEVRGRLSAEAIAELFFRRQTPRQPEEVAPGRAEQEWTPPDAWSESLPSRSILFSQQSVQNLVGPGLQMMFHGEMRPIAVVQLMDGGLVTFDNTRLRYAWQYGLPTIRAVRLGWDEPFPTGRNRTEINRYYQAHGIRDGEGWIREALPGGRGFNRPTDAEVASIDAYYRRQGQSRRVPENRTPATWGDAVLWRSLGSGLTAIGSARPPSFQQQPHYRPTKPWFPAEVLR